jgi:hypothetical protein
MSNLQPDRRRHARFPVGLPVGLHLEQRRTPVMVELLDISESGARFQAVGDEIHVDERAAFGFVLPDGADGRATGLVVRVDQSGQFVLSLDDKNDGFVGFIRLLETDT